MSHVTCALNGITPEQLDSRLRVTGIRESAPKLRQTLVRPAQGGGVRMICRERESLTVTVRVALPEPDPAERALLAEKLSAWAGDGLLTLTSRPDRRLRVRCTGLPGLEELSDWSTPVTVTFMACEVPWWEDAEATAVVLHSEERRSALVTVPGTAEETPVTARVTCLGDTLDTVLLLCGETAVTLEDLGMTEGNVLLLQEDDTGRLCITVDGADRSACRTADSDDRLLVKCGGIRGFSLTSDGTAGAELEIRGRYL